MKTKLISKLKKEILLVELPRVCDYKLTDEMIFIIDIEKSSSKRIKGSYTLLGKSDEIKAEDAMELVESTIDKWGDDKFRFLDYRYDGCYDLFTAAESLLSGLESEIYWDVNPISKKLGFIGNVSEIDKQIALQKQKRRFDEAQEKTFDKNRTLIFVKN